MVTAVAAWSIWGNDMFPAEADPTGSRLRPAPIDQTTLIKDRPRELDCRRDEKMASRGMSFSLPLLQSGCILQTKHVPDPSALDPDS